VLEYVDSDDVFEVGAGYLSSFTLTFEGFRHWLKNMHGSMISMHRVTRNRRKWRKRSFKRFVFSPVRSLTDRGGR
jgi:hypothetical protein